MKRYKDGPKAWKCSGGVNSEKAAEKLDLNSLNSTLGLSVCGFIWCKWVCVVGFGTNSNANLIVRDILMPK